MDFRSFRPWLFLFSLFTACGAHLLAADEAPAADAPATNDANAPAKIEEPVLQLPKIEVRQSRLTEIDVEIAKLDKQIAREKKHVKSTELDKTLNNAKLTRAAALFGGNSAEHLSALAASRVALMEAERGLLEAMKLPTSLKELSILEKEVEQIRITRRNLDTVRR